MDTQSIVAELEAERDRLNNAIAALRGSRGTIGAGRNVRKRHLTAAQRKRIGDAVRKRWAERKKKSA